MRRILLPSLFILGLTHLLLASPPCTLNYQGRIRLNSTNLPVPDSTGNTVTFNLYTVASGGSSIWTENWNGGTSYVTTNIGLFSVVLGTYNTLCFLPFDVPYYLEIVWTNSSGTAETLSPRQPLTMSPYAKNVVGPLDLTDTSGSGGTAIYAFNNANGTGVYGRGTTGTVGAASTVGGLGVLASDGGMANALALEAAGGAVFANPGFVSFTSYVDFSQATVTGLNLGAAAPLGLTLNSAANSPLSVSNATGTALLAAGGALGLSITASSGSANGAYAHINSSSGSAFYGVNDWGNGISGFNNNPSGGFGVYGSSAGVGTGVGVYGNGGNYGVYGSGTGVGVYGTGSGQFGVEGLMTLASAYAIYGLNSSTSGGIGVYAQAVTATVSMGSALGLSVTATGANGQAIIALANSSSPTVQISNTGVGVPLKINAMTFPSNDGGVAGYVLTTNGTGNLSFQAPGGGNAAPLTLNASTLNGNFVLSASNTGAGYGIVAYNNQPGGFQGSGTGPAIPDFTSNLNGAIKGYTAVSSSAGVVGYSNLTFTGGAGVFGLGYIGVDGAGRTDQAGSIGGAFFSLAPSGNGVHAEADGLNSIGISANSNSGTAGAFQGVTGLVASANVSGVAALLQQNGGYMALDVQGGSQFFGPVTFSSGTTVNFTGVNTIGLSGVTAPLNLVGSIGYPNAVLTASNTGSGFGIIAENFVPGSNGNNGPPDINSTINAAIKGETSVSDSAGVAGYSFLTYTAGVGVLGIGDIGSLGVGTGLYYGSIGGQFLSNAVSGTGMVAQANSGTAGVFQGVTGLVASGSNQLGVGAGVVAIQGSGYAALVVSGTSNFIGSTNFGPGSIVNFNNVTVTGLSSSVSAPLGLSGPIPFPSGVIQGANTGNGNGIVGSASMPGSIGTGATPDLNSPITAGIEGLTSVTNSVGVLGYSTASNSSAGVFGAGTLGVLGVGASTMANSTGGNFYANSSNGTGLVASALSGTGGSFSGVTGLVVSSGSNLGAALYITQGSGWMGLLMNGNAAIAGAVTVTTSGSANSIVGDAAGSGNGVVGYSTTNGDGVIGSTNGAPPVPENGIGVVGYSNNTYGVLGETNNFVAAVYGQNNSAAGDAVGVVGTVDGAGPFPPFPAGVEGNSGAGMGVFGNTQSSSTGTAGVWGQDLVTGSAAIGVMGTTYTFPPNLGIASGVYGFSSGTALAQAGVVGYVAISNTSYSGVYGQGTGMSPGLQGGVSNPGPGSAAVLGKVTQSGAYAVEGVNTAQGGAALYANGTIASSYSSFTDPAGSGNITLNAAAGRIFITTVTSVSSFATGYKVNDSFVTSNSVVMATINSNAASISATTSPAFSVYVPSAGGSFTIVAPSAPTFGSASPTNGISFIVMNLQ